MEDEEKYGQSGHPPQRKRRPATHERPGDDDGKTSRNECADEEETERAATHERHQVHGEADDDRVLDDACEVGRCPGSNAAQAEEMRHVGEGVRVAEGCERRELKDQGGSE